MEENTTNFNYKKLVSIGVVAFLLTSLAVGIYLVRQRTNLEQKAANSTNLSIQPSSQVKSPGEEVTFNLDVASGQNNIIGFDLDIAYDPNVLENINVTAGDMGTNFEGRLVRDTAGQINQTFYTLDTSKAVSGYGTLVTITATIKSSTTDGVYGLNVGNGTLVKALGEYQNVIVGIDNASFTVEKPNPSPTPSPDAEESPVPTPTPSPDSSPDPTPTSSPSPVASPDPTPTPSLEPTTSPSPIASPVLSPTPVASPTTRHPGDVNNDMFVNALDLREVIVHYLEEGDIMADITEDGFVNALDLREVIVNYLNEY